MTRIYPIKRAVFYRISYFFLVLMFYGCVQGPTGGSGRVTDPLKAEGASTATSFHRPEDRSEMRGAPRHVAGENGEKGETHAKGQYARQPPHEEADGLPTRKIYMNMRDVELTVLLRTLARIAGQSIMISNNVRGRASINISNEPWNEVFHSLLRTYGLTYVRDGSIIRIVTLEDMEKDFKILELAHKREAKKKELENLAPLVTRVISIEFSSAEALKQIFDEFLKTEAEEKRGAVMVDSHTNSLIIQATRKDTERLAAIVRELDRPTYQVRIEARIVEANNETARELGVEWGGLYASGTGDHNFLVAPGITSDSLSVGDKVQDTLTPGLMQQFSSTTQDGVLIGFIDQKVGQYLLGLQLSALEKEGKVKILSSPAISTLDNQKAVIESGSEVPFQTVEDDEVNIEFKKAVLRLEVTPHVIDGNFLKINILTRNDQIDSSIEINGNPAFSTKTAETSVLLRDGQTTVIGGLRKESFNDSESGFPLLKDIPLLGRLFRKSSTKNRREEVLIFITPHILRRDIREAIQGNAGQGIFRDTCLRAAAPFRGGDGLF